LDRDTEFSVLSIEIPGVLYQLHHIMSHGNVRNQKGGGSLNRCLDTNRKEGLDFQDVYGSGAFFCVFCKFSKNFRPRGGTTLISTSKPASGGVTRPKTTTH
jgi:hypothetical protein